MRKSAVGLGVLLVLPLFVNGEVRISLDDLDWSVHNKNKDIDIPAKIPGGIYTDLQNAGKISQNLFYRFNDIEYRWVGLENWTYRTEFNVPPDVLKKSAVNLVLHGVDTIATVYINSHLVGVTQNMFVRYVLPIKDYLKEINNSLEVKFKSPITEAKNLFNNHNYTVPPACVPFHYNGECHINFLRKMQVSFSWDWGPAFPSVGLWKPVEIEAFDSGVLRDVTIKLEHFNATTWRVRTKAYIEPAVGNDIGEYEVSGRLLTNKMELSATSLGETVEDGEIVSTIQFMVPKESVDVWWPNGFGSQPLYQINITFMSKMTPEASQKSVKIGFRLAELVQARLRQQKEGFSFYFRINGLPIFAKGSNWIPSHILPELSYNKERVRSLLLAAKEAHMNILRVWGGGLYESDLFYQMADEMGLMIWQDMMYACSMYPVNPEFLESVKLETAQQVKRIQHHPSIILWAGNNENEAALRGDWYRTHKNFELYKSDYIKLYVDTIRPVIYNYDDTRPYVVSSPSNGLMTENEGYISKDPYSPLYGDTHFYNYILDSWISITYPYTRFASEYGFQSLPSLKTMSEVTLPKDRKIGSEFSTKRQHLLAGYVLMALQIKLRLPFPKKSNAEEYYKNFIYYSQISQAMGTKTETEKYRRDRNKLTNKNEGRTMGAMYWQLNDVWQAPSWSSIDFSGRWKMLHYYAQKFFSPVIISPDMTIDNKVNVFVVSDLVHDIPESVMNISVYSWDNFEPRRVISTAEIIRNSRSKIHARHALPELFKDCNVTECFLYVTLTSTQFNINVDNVLFPISFSKVTNLKPAKITVQVTEKKNDTHIVLELTTDRIAPFVWIETDEPGQFSENGFILLKKKKIITFSNRNETIDINRLRRSLTVRSLLR